MRTLTRRLAPHARAAWLSLAAGFVLVTVVVLAIVLASGGGRYGVVATLAAGVVGFVVMAAVLDAILVPGNPDVCRAAGHAAGWTGAVGGGGWSDGGGSGGDGGSCG